MLDVITVLLVEDEPLILMAIEEALEAGGYTVIAVTSGADAISVLHSRHRDIVGIITDVRLGSVADGWEVSRHARELRPDMPVVYATGDSAPNRRGNDQACWAWSRCRIASGCILAKRPYLDDMCWLQTFKRAELYSGSLMTRLHPSMC